MSTNKGLKATFKDDLLKSLNHHSKELFETCLKEAKTDKSLMKIFMGKTLTYLFDKELCEHQAKVNEENPIRIVLSSNDVVKQVKSDYKIIEHD